MGIVAAGVEVPSGSVYAFSSTTSVNGTIDSGISRLGAASLAIGNGTAGDVTGTLSLTTIDLPDGGSLFIYDATHSKYVRAVYETGGSLYIGSGGATANNLVLELTGGGNNIVLNATAFDFQTAALPLVWNSDTGISRLAGAELAIGNGTAGDFSGVLKLAELIINGGSNSCQINETGGTGRLGFSTGGNNQFALTSLLIVDMDINTVLGWDSHATGTLGYTVDTGISRLGAASLAIGNGTAGDFTGALTLGNLSQVTAVGSAVANSPTHTLSGVYQATSGPTYAADTWTIQNVIGAGTNGQSVLTFAHSGTTGFKTISVPNGTDIGVTSSGAGITLGSGNLVSMSNG